MELWIAPIAGNRPSLLLREWHLIEVPSHGCLTVGSLTEAKLFANITASWIENHGVEDPIFVAYFGAGQNNYTIQDVRFTVCS